MTTPKTQVEQDIYWMKHALSLADNAEQQGEIPVGSVLVVDNKVVGEGWNQSISLHDPSAHAEMQAIRQAGQRLQNYRMVDATLYVTLEPCPMCAGLLVHSRIARLVFGAADYKTGAAGSVMNLLENKQLNHQVNITGGIEDEVCGEKISAFFRYRRAQKKATKLSAYQHED
ncbi:tRNA adenosine(34) deaminase TadA [Paraglaciecola sp.]|uniref:tRNA adenosine(34) deaminase TadA n=1 Tax=Paraglaciecola sp. TaxID=1920173 RepID=UPI0030F43C56